MKIVVDSMGGDNAPFINIEGAIQYLNDPKSIGEVILVGKEDLIRHELQSRSFESPRLHIQHASQVVTMDESPTKSYKEKKDSSMRVGIGLVKTNEADAFISAGNTGATMTYSLLSLGRIPGVDRPAVGAFMPHEKGATLLLDVGAVAEAKPKNLLQFGIMGSIVHRYLTKTDKPRVGLMSIGEEAEKGTSLVREAKRLLEDSSLNFKGYAEGRDIFFDKFDVIVTDGFTGNVSLKLAESTFKTLFSMIKRRIDRPSRLLGARLIKPVFTELMGIFDPNNYGGSPLLGIKGISLIAHGSSNEKAIKAALFEAQSLIKSNMIDAIEQEITKSLSNIVYTDMDEQIIHH
ncbi:MAG: phosphate acyltransferase PlsX [Candidatus Marinimicrobia bacterium]|jgi:glycerol-3-phosphate acyltransferase PlsX|nr:phosphate acyltransferase PlsX [Candidatus Neomarinimicrobiota bacterium]MBT3576521.1 phosphate acyltransferase PlsX [Candidatus Neomarinimicrobiota bacterium]MBT3681307.1 phosphate acyltransferase PlsX [Candidatus Neomarinimicrobiota bacterium]MBT3951521.1 phosphate acyltransferase PlsX [Candidatus Neomarinimicrobiota bacterium]MBT4253913.1 phosphate acyltransferase PlsX [Candidatus Neomarinimicrobiota bacterium]